MSENVGASTSRNPKGLHGLYRDNFTFTFYLPGLELRPLGVVQPVAVKPQRKKDRLKCNMIIITCLQKN
jgi:hypothetical protein